MDSINYAALNLDAREQLGSDKRTSSSGELKDFDYTDGLTKKELEKIDKNKDGAISEEEFKAAFGGNSADAYKQYWDGYKSFYNATANKKTSSGSESTMTKPDGTVVTSYFDKNGKLERYKEEKANDQGSIVQEVYKYIDGEEQLQKKTKQLTNGQIYSMDKSGATTCTNVDGSSATQDKSGNLLSIKTAEENGSQVNFKYNTDGKMSSVEINGKKYTNITEKDGTTTIKDKDGNIVAKLSTDGSANTYFTEYKNGKKSQRIELDSDGMPVHISKYDKNGKLATKQFCKENLLREYHFDKSGKLTDSVDTKDGKLYSKQTYSDLTEKDIYGKNRPSDRLWASRTFYDENEKVKTYQEYAYDNSDGEIKKTITQYTDNTKTTKKNTYVYVQDEHTNVLSKTIYDKNGTEKSNTTYNYDTNKVDKELPDNHIKSTVVNNDNEKVVNTFKDGVLSTKEVNAIRDGVGVRETYHYKYYTNGQEKEVTKKNQDGTVVEVTEYNEAGEKTSQKVNLVSILKSKYPDLPDYQINIIAGRCKGSSGNKLNTNSLVNMDLNSSDFDIKIPNFTVEGGILNF